MRKDSLQIFDPNWGKEVLLWRFLQLVQFTSVEGDIIHVRIDNMDIMSILVLWKDLNVECDDGDNFFI